MRTPSCTSPTIPPLEENELALADLQLQMVTPMFGGGVEAGKLNEDNLIRPSSIRGHLRFWWRASNAARFETLKGLHAEETRLWGTAADDANPEVGNAAIRIQVMDVGKREKGTTFPHDDPQAPKYVLFPFYPQDHGNTPAQDGRIGVTFRLRVSVSPLLRGVTKTECLEAARQALWAWIVFGGIGARTRRGCGTLRCIDGQELPLTASQFQPPRDLWSAADWIGRAIAELPGDDSACPGFPSLAGCRVVINDHEASHLDAWLRAVAPFETFLQGRGVGRN